MIPVAEAVNPFLGAAFFLVAAGSAESGIESVVVESLFQGVGFHDLRVLLGAVGHRAHAVLTFRVDPDPYFHTVLLGHQRPEPVHLAEFPLGIDMHQGKRNPARLEGLMRQVQHHGRILADGVQHHRVFELGRDLSNDVDALGFQLLEV